MKFQDIKSLSEKFIADNNLITEDVVEFVEKLTGKNIMNIAVKAARQPSQESIDRLNKVEEAINELSNSDKFTILSITEQTGLDKGKVQYALAQLQEQGKIFVCGKLEVEGARGKKPNLYAKVVSE